MKSSRFATLSLLLACGATAVHAANGLSASVKFTDLTFYVTDLTPSDGIAPFFELLPSDRIKSVTQVIGDMPLFFEEDSNVAFLGNASVTKTLSDSAMAQAKITSNAVEAQVASPTDTVRYLQATANLLGSGGVPLIRIAPGTGLTFSGNTELVVNANCGRACYAQALLELNFGYLGEEGSATQVLSTIDSSPNKSFSGLVGLTYANNSTEDQFLGLVVRTDVQAFNAVPEPATWALALGGGLLALGLRRRGQPG